MRQLIKRSDTLRWSNLVQLLLAIGLSLAARSGAQSTFATFLLAVGYTTPMAWIFWRLIEMPLIVLAKS